MKYCIHCGSKISSSAQFCPYCGYSQNIEQNLNYPKLNNYKPKKEHKGHRLKICLSLVISLIIIVVGMGVYQARNCSTNTHSSGETHETPMQQYNQGKRDEKADEKIDGIRF